MKRLYPIILTLLFVCTFNHTHANERSMSITNFELPPEFSEEFVNSIAVDTRGLAYFGFSKGIFEFDSRNWRFILPEENMAVNRMIVSGLGRIMVSGDINLGYLQVADRGDMVYSTLNRQGRAQNMSPIINTIQYGNGVLIITRDGFFAVTELGQYELYTQLDWNPMASGLLGERLIVVDENRGLMQLDLNSIGQNGGSVQNAYRPINGGSHIRARHIIALSESELVIATLSRGLMLLKFNRSNGSFMIERWDKMVNVGQNGYQVTALHDFNGRFLAVGTAQHGILLLDEKGRLIDQFNTANGLPNNLILNLYFARNGRLWASTPNGISSIAIATGSDISDMRRDSSTRDSDSLEFDDSSYASDVNRKVSIFRKIKDAMYELYRGLTPGYRTYTRLDFTGVRADDFAAVIRDVTEIRRDSTVFRGAFIRDSLGIQDNNQIDSFNQYVFPSRINSFRFSFTSNQFENVDQIEFQVFMEGFDDGWSSFSRNVIREYTNLDFGIYQFRVRARNNNGEISMESAFRFEVKPPWHRSLWFLAVQLGVLFSMLVLSTYLSRYGKAEKFSEFIIYLVIIISFEYLLMYLSPFLYKFTDDIAFFEIMMSVAVGIALIPVENAYSWLLAKITGAPLEHEGEDNKSVKNLLVSENNEPVQNELSETDIV